MKRSGVQRQFPMLLVVAALACAVMPAKAQGQDAPFEIAVTYNALRSLQAGANQNFWQQGGSAELNGRFWKGLGVVADVTGTHTGSINGTGVPLSLVTTTFGPRYRFADHRRVSPYGQALIGIANGFNSVFPGTSGADTSASSLALQINGGVDVRMNRRLAVRVIDVGWLRTQLPNATADVQNNLRLGAGLVLRISR